MHPSRLCTLDIFWVVISICLVFFSFTSKLLLADQASVLLRVVFNLSAQAYGLLEERGATPLCRQRTENKQGHRFDLKEYSGYR